MVSTDGFQLVAWRVPRFRFLVPLQKSEPAHPPCMGVEVRTGGCEAISSPHALSGPGGASEAGCLEETSFQCMCRSLGSADRSPESLPAQHPLRGSKCSLAPWVGSFAMPGLSCQPVPGSAG